MIKHNLKPRLQSQSNAIISALALAWAESLRALHSTRIRTYLGAHNGGHLSITEIKTTLAALARAGFVSVENGWCLLERSATSLEESITRAKTSARKIRGARAVLFLLQAMPFIKAAAITGSVAFGNATKKSDVDVFCVAQERRIWTARAGALILSELFGRRTERSVRSGKDKLCFNYFATPDADIPVKNIASAHMFAEAIPFFGETEFRQFLAKNKWMKEFLSGPDDAAHTTPSAHLPGANGALVFIKTAIEKTLSGTFGGMVERACKTWQMARLSKKIAAGGDASHFAANDAVIALHHPRPKNKEVMKRYRQKMKDLGIFE
ncbi:nucleotidyltransferase domain-containing protein [Candidatus Azambacteria bacterium]|nr:nucleotidyltransferase domain-containing protein [Candidatus Azambacteria bacterium]